MARMLTNGQLNIFNMPKPMVGGFVESDGLGVDKYDFYNLETYQSDVLNKGLKQTWRDIIWYVLNGEIKNDFISWNHFAELYEIGLALRDKQAKKESGQYYTPDDVAMVMSDWFESLVGDNVCDVACGTGKLILTYLDTIGERKAIELIRSGKLYLYDSDETALSICKTVLLLKYGKQLEPYIHAIHCDFLSKTINLPDNCKVISNPPYATVNVINSDWSKTNVATHTKELYSMFMEKIIKQSTSSVIITPYSFIGGSKFYSLRKIMNNYNGFIVAFDNVPGNIFCGRKHGIFNTNTANSVRATITVVENKREHKGFRVTPLIRFKNEERSKLLKTDVLETFINDKYQIVNEETPMYYKCSKELNDILDTWKRESSKCLGDYVSQEAKNVISMPNTCRYFTTASNGLLHRNGQIILNVENEDVFNYLYCLINSSFAYWYWRLYDGGITYSRKLLLSMPVFYDKLSADDKVFFRNIATEMMGRSKQYSITKNNVGIQENIKFPKIYRNAINDRLLKILGCEYVGYSIFDAIHKNCVFDTTENAT